MKKLKMKKWVKWLIVELMTFLLLYIAFVLCHLGDLQHNVNLVVLIIIISLHVMLTTLIEDSVL